MCKKKIRPKTASEAGINKEGFAVTEIQAYGSHLTVF